MPEDEKLKRANPVAEPWWRSTWLAFAIGGILAVYIGGGFAFEDFITDNPMPTWQGIGGGIAVALLKVALGGVVAAIWLPFLIGNDLTVWTFLRIGVVLVVLFSMATERWQRGVRHMEQYQLAPKNEQVDRCTNEIAYRGPRTGADCRDGRYSRSTGSGTCSHHGGVEEWVYANARTRTHAECRARVERYSWR